MLRCPSALTETKQRYEGAARMRAAVACAMAFAPCLIMGMIMLDKGMRLWTYKHARANFWKVEDAIGWDDLMQEAHAAYAKVQARYPNRTTANQMALYKTIFKNRMTDIARNTMKCIPLTNECDLNNITLTDLSDAQTFAHPDISDRLAQLPEPIRRALFALADDPRAEITFLWVNGAWETPDAKLCRLAGIKPTAPPNIPIVDMVRNFLLGDDPDPALLAAT